MVKIGGGNSLKLERRHFQIYFGITEFQWRLRFWNRTEIYNLGVLSAAPAPGFFNKAPPGRGTRVMFRESEKAAYERNRTCGLSDFFQDVRAKVIILQAIDSYKGIAPLFSSFQPAFFVQFPSKKDLVFF